MLAAVAFCPTGQVQASWAGDGPRIVNIRNGDVLSGVVTVEVSAWQGQLVALLLGDTSEQPVAVGEVTSSRSGRGLIPLSAWTNFLDNGDYWLVVQDFAGHTDTRRVTVRNGINEVRVERQDLPISEVSLPLIGADVDYRHHGPIGGFVAPPNARRPWKLSIVNRQGRTVRTYRDISDSMSVYWHGDDAQGRVVPDGDYQALTTTPAGTFPICLIHKRASPPAAAPRPARPAATGLRVSGVRDGATLSGDVVASVSMPSGRRGYATLSVDDELVTVGGDGRVGRSAWKRRQPLPFLLHTTAFSNGPHLLRVLDFAGHGIVRHVRFQNAVSQVHYDSNLDTQTAPEGVVHSAHIAATLVAPQPWTLTIRDEQGRVVQTFSGKGRSIAASYDGTDDHRRFSEEKCYEVTVETGGRNYNLGAICVYTSPE